MTEAKKKKTGRRGFSQIEIQERRLRIARSYKQGVTQEQIAAKEGVSRHMVQKDIACIREEWKQRYTLDYETKRIEELAKIDATEAAAWEAWERSKQDKQRKTAKDVDGKKETSVMVEGQSGDPRFLNIILDCVRRRCRLQGLDEPTKIDLDGQIHGTVEVLVETHEEAMTVRQLLDANASN